MTTAVRILALALCLVATGMLAMMSLQVVFPLAIAVAAIVGYSGRFQLGLTKRAESRLAVGVALVFALRWLGLPPPGLGASHARFVSIGILDYAYAYPIAQALLVWLVLLFYLRQNNAMPQSLPLYPALVAILAGTMPSRALGEWRNVAYQSAALTLALLAGAYFTMHTRVRTDSQRPASHIRRNAYVLVFVVTLFLGWASGFLVYRHGTDIDFMLGELVRDRGVPASAGFSKDGRLGRISAHKSLNDNAIALHIASASLPGYLRGKAFDGFEGREWTSSAKVSSLRPVADAPATPFGGNWFPLIPGVADPSSDHIAIEPAKSLRGVVFTRLESAQIGAPVDELRVDDYAIVEAEQVPTDIPYQLAGTASPNAPLSELERAALTAVSDEIDPRIRETAVTITKNCRNDIERLGAVTSYLRETCSYSLDEPLNLAKDPIAAFLFESRKGHCEYFATAAALLLRCAGVPSRYVTGFVSAERNEYGNYWVARNKDAHAWVEAYIEGQGWVTVEATPATGVPQGGRSKFAQLWEYTAHRAKAAIASVRNMGWREIAHATTRASRTWWPIIAIAAGVGAMLFIRRQRAAKRRRIVSLFGSDPIAQSMNRWLRAMDRRAARLGYVRGTNETLHRFADRIERETQSDIALWYRMYALARYGKDEDAMAFVSAQRNAT